MVRAEKHITTFPWSELVKEYGNKYNRKWIEGPDGKFWVNSVYYDTAGYTRMVHRTDDYSTPGMKKNDC